VSTSEQSVADVPAELYQRLADFRYKIRQFLRFSEEAARAHGIEPQQHQLMLVIKGLAPGTRPTVRNLSNRLCLRHNSTVELVNRLADRGALVRRPCEQDRREVLVELTPYGEELLNKLSLLHWQELRANGPALSEALLSLSAETINGHASNGHTAAAPTALTAEQAC
jgi:DNA-binding MarR family transcriptional regulator